MFARCECGLLRGRRATQGVSPVTPCHNLGIVIVTVIVIMVMVIIINSPFVRLHGQTDQTEFDDLISALRSLLLQDAFRVADIFFNRFVICQIKDCGFSIILLLKHRTGDVFGENIDKFKRNRKSRTSPPRSFVMKIMMNEKIMMEIMISC